MLRVIFAAAFGLLLLFPWVLGQPDPAAYAQADDVQCWAVIVGVADYQNFGPAPWLSLPSVTYDLEYSDGDAQDLYDELSSVWVQTISNSLLIVRQPRRISGTLY